MKSIIFKTVLFILLLLLISTAFNWIVPYWWGSNKLSAKFRYLKKSEGNYNTLFVGSSKIHHQIIPDEFDAYFNGKINSFNLGFAGHTNPSAYFFCEKLIKDSSIDISYLIVELWPVASIRKEHLHTKEIKYWLNFNYLLSTLQSINSKEFNKVQTKRYLISYIEKILNIGMYAEKIRFLASRVDPTDADFSRFGIDEEGFLNLDAHLKRKSSERNDLRLRRTRFLKDPEPLFEKKRISEHLFRKSYRDDQIDEIHLKNIERLISLAEKHHVQLIFLITPKLSFNELNRIVPISRKIDPLHIIEASNGQIYPELYEIENSFDYGHLNKKGASIFTKIVASKFREIIADDLDING